MAILEVLTHPNPNLRKVAKPVKLVDDRIRNIMDDMLETMYHHEGVGLAAIQVGIEERIIVMDVDYEMDENGKPIRGKGTPYKMANPEILWVSEEKYSLKEGCLSVPDQRAEVFRPEKVKIRYLNENNEQKELEASGFLATCIQHEVDHLNGVLYIDHLSQLKRSMLLKKLSKQCRN